MPERDPRPTKLKNRAIARLADFAIRRFIPPELVEKYKNSRLISPDAGPLSLSQVPAKPEHGIKPDFLHLPKALAYYDVTGLVADLASLTSVGAVVIHESRRGGTLRMSDGAKRLTNPDKENYLERFIENGLDILTIDVKRAYHKKRMMRYVKGLAFDIAVLVPAVLTKVGHSLITGNIRFGKIALGLLAADVIRNTLLTYREFDERRQLKKRRRITLRTDQTANEELKHQVQAAVDFIGVPQNRREDLTRTLYNGFTVTRRERKQAYDNLKTAGKYGEAMQVARELERWDWFSDSPWRLTILPARLLNRLSQKRIHKERELTRARGYEYDRTERRYVPAYEVNSFYAKLVEQEKRSRSLRK